MKNKKTSFLVGGAAIIVALILVWAGQKNNTTMIASVSTEQSASVAGNTTSSTTSKANEYTISQVAAHSTRSDCWTAINGSVYNVTSWISQHPGGEAAILSLCGIDGSSAFNGQHGGQRRPANELATFKVGTLIK